MGKAEENKRLKRVAILDAALQLFTDQGWSKTSISDIAARSGVAKGTFYLFPGITKTGLDSAGFCKAALEQAHVLMSPGSAFGKSGAGHVRIAVTQPMEKLQAAFDRLEAMRL